MFRRCRSGSHPRPAADPASRPVRVRARGSHPMPAGPMDATAPYAAPAVELTRTTPAGRAGSGFDEELRQLLRYRLLLFQLLTIAYAALLLIMDALTPE